MGIPNMSLPELRPVQTENPMDQYAKALQVRAMGQQSQLTALQTQQQQLALKDQQAMTQAMHDWDGKDINALIPLTVKYGASANAVMGLKSKVLEQQEKYSTIAKDDAETGAKNLETLKGKNDMMVGALNTVMGAKDEEIVATLQSTAADLAQRGLLDAPHAQQVQQMAGLPPDQIRKKLQLFEKGYRSDTQQIEDAAKQAVTAKDSAEARLTEQKIAGGAGVPVDQQELNAWLNAPQANGKTRRDNGLTASDYEQAKLTHTSTQSDSLGVTSTTTSAPGLNRGAAAPPNAPRAAGPASSLPAPSLLPPGSGKMTPDQVRNNIVDMVGQYRYNPTQLARLQVKHPEIIAAINQKYPDWDQTTYQAKAKLVTDYTSGVHSKEINAINTTMGHVAELGDAIDALKNGDLKILNAIGNKLQIETGGTPAATLALIARRVAPEIATVYTPSGGGQTERIADEKDFDSSLGPDILKANVSKTVDLLRSKIGALESQYKNTVGRDDFEQRFITPQAKGALQKYSTHKQAVGAPASGGGFDWNAHPIVK